MKSRVKASERAVARERLLGLVQEEDQGGGLEFDVLELSVMDDGLIPRPLRYLDIPSIPAHHQVVSVW